MSSGRNDELADREVDRSSDPLHVVPGSAELERAIASVSGVATAQVHTTADGHDRLRLTLIAGADPEVVAWAVAATLRERFGIALDPATIALRPPTEPDDVATDDAGRPPPPPRLPRDADGFAGEPSLAAAARDAVRRHEPPVPGAPSVAEAAALLGVGDAEVIAPGGPRRPRPAPRRGAALRDAAPVLDRSAAAADEVPATAAAAFATDAAEDRPVAPPDPRDDEADAAAPVRRRRAAIAELVARPDGDDLAVVATLRLADREVTGAARGLGTRRGRWRAIAHATLLALGELTEGQLRADVDHITVLTFPDLAHVTVAVTVLGHHGEERFLGAAMMHDDPDRAVMRATLDAVNRRVEPWLAEGDATA